MSEKSEPGQSGEMETQQAFLRHTIDLNSELIAQADRLITASRGQRTTEADANPGD